MTWKNQSKKDPNKRPISQFENLHFDPTDDSTFPEEKLPKNEEISNVNGDDDDNDTIKLVESCQQQGNKLVEEGYLPNGCTAVCTITYNWTSTFISLLFIFIFLFLKEGKYREALGKWESALLLMPDRAILHEQKAQILLELGETWKALQAATRATELEPSWGEAWVTLGRAQLNYGEPDSAIESLDRALAIKPDSAEARNDRQAALHHISEE
ncbi:tetratricopeptide repeat protein 33-like [Solanum tuberosum]|uniref:tetratricopeptide repeat protein 33-like n=1 Tax=Solanum tuberosum TaxID=4113 RepID=UPI00073A34B6|nr:PREDICTED: tetratricopeptide repeat protein 33-like [Solanum tuberosum]